MKRLLKEGEKKIFRNGSDLNLGSHEIESHSISKSDSESTRNSSLE
ncbi:hypothetical protein LEP1GSC052_3396 [Leptospira kmetyi serovar Malaysia str. Bejo-Iso9]|nr:hypothetical protein LEP1GSC052_3396 [Leptospira kmetyi serovar Malaysia str. Bejo-Iso9]